VSAANDVSGGGLLPQTRFLAHCRALPPPRRFVPILPTRGRDKKVGWGIVANENARALRKGLTPQEVKLWVKLRELKPLGFHFRRQAPVGPYIVDFISFRSQLVIEADGGQHGMPEGNQADRARDAFLRSQGFKVLRF
jgi:very-short-patch-repair endonuclease